MKRMEPTPNIPPQYSSKILPSKKILVAIAVIIIAFAAYYLVPVIIKKISHLKKTPSSDDGSSVAVLTGDPTTRDTDGDGVPDWQEIIVGLDPRNPETKHGTPDAVAFENIRSQVGADTFAQQAAQVTDTDKVALALYDGYSNDAAVQGQSTNGAVSAITETEVFNYITAKKAKNKKYTAKDLTTTGNTTPEVKAYYDALKSSSANILDKEFTTHLTAYIQGKEPRSAYFDKKIPLINKLVADALKIPVPTTAVANHLQGLNALSGIAQTLDTYDATTPDELSQFGTLGLIQDYINEDLTANGNLTLYFSVVLDPKNAPK